MRNKKKNSIAIVVAGRAPGPEPKLAAAGMNVKCRAEGADWPALVTAWKTAFFAAIADGYSPEYAPDDPRPAADALEELQGADVWKHEIEELTDREAERSGPFSTIGWSYPASLREPVEA